MTVFPTKEELSHDVYVSAPITARWGGVDYDLTKPTKLTYGIVYHWKQAHPDVEFTVTDVQQAEVSARSVVNPLDENDRGEAFAGLKRTRKPKEGE